MSEALEEVRKGKGERRSQERYTMILRVGILEHAGKNSFCLVKNISATGVQLKLYTSASIDHEVRVWVADEEPISGRIVWIRDGVAGIRFDSRIDPQALLRLQQKLRAVRRRSMPRIAASGYTAVRMGGRNIASVLRDISSMGAKISTSRPLEAGGLALVRFPGLPEIRAYVRWVDDCDSGLVFETPIPMQIIAEWLDQRPRTA
jgi:hypothetical protein